MEEGKLSWWWLSFADPELPAGRQFLGVVIVRGDSIISAVKEAWRLKINPGGQAAGVSLPDDVVPPPEFREKLLDRETATGPLGRKRLFGSQTMVPKKEKA
jgi:hypothetical protein